MSRALRISSSCAVLPKSVSGWLSLLQQALAVELQDVVVPQHFAIVKPDSREPAPRFSIPKEPTRSSAVLVLVCPCSSNTVDPAVPDHSFLDVALLLTMRSSTLRSHGGQMSFPGGKLDGNETAEQGAMRECEEEVGVCPAGYQLLGRLRPVWSYPSQSWVTPVVALASAPVAATINSPDEVSSIHYLHMSELLCASEFSHHQLVKHFSRTSYGSLQFPCFFASDHVDRPIDDGVHPERGNGPPPRRPEDRELTPVTVDQCDGALTWGLTADIACQLVARLSTIIARTQPSNAHLVTLRTSKFVVRDPEHREPVATLESKL